MNDIRTDAWRGRRDLESLRWNNDSPQSPNPRRKHPIAVFFGWALLIVLLGFSLQTAGCISIH